MQARNMTLYSIFVRNYGGSFAAVERDLDRLQKLGVDAIWLLPIHPIGAEKRKGSLGSPYAISDYRAINPEFGTMEDFIRLCDAAHARGMKVLIDVVYHHTSPDSVLAKTHPEYFYRTPEGKFGNRIGDWTDIIDLDFADRGLWTYLIDALCFWAKYVDGFRCDVASLVPLAFWKEAHDAVAEVRPDCLWLAESVDYGFIRCCRSAGMDALSDSELYQVFDVCYDYDIYDDFRAYVKGKEKLPDYVAAVMRQESTFPRDYVKLRFLENHDRDRAAQLFPDQSVRENWLAWMFFQKGMPMLYSGQEWAPAHCPSLFDPDPVYVSGAPMHEALLEKLIALKKDPIFADGNFEATAHAGDIIVASWQQDGRRLIGVFSMKGKGGIVKVPLDGGKYRDLLSGASIPVRLGRVTSFGIPMILTAE